MLQQPYCLLVHELSNHITQDGTHSIKALICLTNILQAHVIQQDLLNDEYRNGLAELGAGLHDAEAERNDLGCEEEVDHFRAVVLDQGSNDTKGRKAEVFERT
jgi:hypothetical protein